MGIFILLSLVMAAWLMLSLGWHWWKRRLYIEGFVLGLVGAALVGIYVAVIVKMLEQ